MTKKNHVKKLPNAPLKEVIFDLRWSLDTDDESKHQYDQRFDFALGTFRQLIKEDFPFAKRLVSPFVPKDFSNHIPKFRFLQTENNFPIVQIGEGILTINNNDITYEWDNQFFPLIKSTLEKLMTSYEGVIKFSQISLKYIDVVSIEDVAKNDYLIFLEENLNYKVKKNFTTNGTLNAFNFTEEIFIEDDYTLTLNFSTALDTNNENQLIWQTNIINKMVNENTDIINWVEKAHDITSDLFIKMLNEEFYDKFK